MSSRFIKELMIRIRGIKIDKVFTLMDGIKIKYVLFVMGRDHVETNGPNGSKLIQYFACKNSLK